MIDLIVHGLHLPPLSIHSISTQWKTSSTVMFLTVVAHVPEVFMCRSLVVILLKAAEKWRETSSAKIPTTNEEKRAFRSTIQNLRRTEKKADIEVRSSSSAHCRTRPVNRKRTLPKLPDRPISSGHPIRSVRRPHPIHLSSRSRWSQLKA